MLLSYIIVNFYLSYDGAVKMQIWAFLNTSVFDTLVTVKGCGPFVLIINIVLNRFNGMDDF